MALATSSMTQQILTYPSHIVPSNLPTSLQALAPRSDLYISSSPLPAGSVGTPDLKIQQSIKSALFNPSNSSIPAVAPSCGSGRCTWPLYSSLAICSKVANVSSFLSITPNPLSQGNLSSDISSTENSAILLNGANLQAGPARMNISTPLALVNGSGVAIANHSLAFTNESSIVFTAINNYFVIFQNDAGNDQGRFGAIEVLTYWCVNNYNTSVVSGVASTNVNATSEKVARIDTNAVILTSQNGKENFTVDAQAGQVLADYMAMTFLGYAAGTGGGTSSDAAAALQRVLFEAPSEASAKGLAADEMQLEGMQNFTQNMVVSLTNAIRALPFRGEAVIGTSYTLEPHIHVSWGWLSFLLFLLTSSFVFFVVTIWKSRRMDIEPLGSSMLATMCVLSEERRSALGDVETRDKMKEKARAVRVRFERNDPRGVGSEEGIREGGEGGSGSSWRLESRGI